MCAGAMAKRYEAFGGQVIQHGKPYTPIYALSFARLGAIDRKRVLAIGDGLGTDIAGAAAAGLDAVLITGGLHAEALGLSDFADPEPQGLAQFCSTWNQRPMAALPAFRW
jgi:ribonucleotide monophosphatase NagD (HAD superfamily)